MSKELVRGPPLHYIFCRGVFAASTVWTIKSLASSCCEEGEEEGSSLLEFDVAVSGIRKSEIAFVCVLVWYRPRETYDAS